VSQTTVETEPEAARSGPGRPRARRSRSGTTVPRAVATFALSGLVAIALLGGALALVLRNAGTDEAIRDARQVSTIVGHDVVEPVLRDSILHEDPRAIAALDRVVGGRVLDGNILRVKVWDGSGRIVYSDKASLIGSRYRLGADELDVLRHGGAEAQLSDLNRPENRFERSFGQLLEVYLPVHTPDGTPLLFETYTRFSAVKASGHKVWLSFLPILLLGLLLLALVQIPLAWAMARGLERGRADRERLLQRAVESSDSERRRLARDLHDGVVQDFAGLAMSLSGAADQAETAGASDAADSLRDGANRTRAGIRQLRTLLVEIHPPNLHATGLEPALSDLLAPLGASGVRTSLDVEPGLDVDGATEALVFRVAQEALRNAHEHAEATAVQVTLSRDGDLLVLAVRDDGRGFSPEEVARRGEEGHMGLGLVAELAEEAGGRLEVRSTAGGGSTIRLEIPAR
jgi:two-component system, NarL family, sensor kinase